MNAILATRDLVFDNYPNSYSNWEEEEIPEIVIKKEKEFKIDVESFLNELDSNEEFILNKWQEIVLNQNLSMLNKSIDNEIEYLTEENIIPPTEHVISQTKNLLEKLAVSNINPYKLGLSAEEGICLTFDNFNNKMYFELYNNKEIGFIIEDKLTGKVVQNTDLYSINDGLRAIENFYRSYAFSERITY